MKKSKRRIFLHFHNYEILKLYSGDLRDKDKLLRHSLLLTKYALLVSHDPLLIQPKFFFETPYFNEYMKKIRALVSAGLIDYTGSQPIIFEIEEKQNQYRNHELFHQYNNELNVENSRVELRKLRFIPRQESSSLAIKNDWIKDISSESGAMYNSLINDGASGCLPEKLVYEIVDAPLRLKGEAFILDNVNKVLSRELIGSQKLNANILINKAFILSYLNEFNAMILVDTPLFALDCGLNTPDHLDKIVSVNDFRRYLNSLSLRNVIDDSLSWSRIVQLREMPEFINIVGFYFSNTNNYSALLINDDWSYNFGDAKGERLFDEVIKHIKVVSLKLRKYFDFSGFPDEANYITLANKDWISKQKNRNNSERNKVEFYIFESGASMSKNTIEVKGDVTGSNFMQDSNHSSQSLVNSKELDLNDLLSIVTIFKEQLNKLEVSNDLRKEVEAEIGTLEVQIQSPKPKMVIIGESIKTIRNICEGATGSILASEFLLKLTPFLALIP
ncbi:MAG: hypothetical protein KJ556_10395 [Gammaproteobacteria bacterium]|nr:hypothetical protein [Gammaproteobacteria bacterium]MBU2058499.1 hypothetical protein [Gammaproteobacteria bacterium]MBU2175524.1 hypothetical protein [Gammaproteobacteria bacterium]MBU2248610.1 hypothetical protein [Gammaproteobacteria bacterium]MBU2342636.1 hypothetical protein [Gammaproteobacteria bacterium]